MRQLVTAIVLSLECGDVTPLSFVSLFLVLDPSLQFAREANFKNRETKAALHRRAPNQKQNYRW
jgi:hypothetical protein